MKTLLALGLTAVFVLVIGAGTLTPPGDGAPLPLSDKALHFIAFAGLVLPLGWFRPGWWPWVAALALAYGATIEVIQPQVGRDGEWADLLADLLGIGAGLLPGQVRRVFKRA